MTTKRILLSLLVTTGIIGYLGSTQLSEKLLFSLPFRGAAEHMPPDSITASPTDTVPPPEERDGDFLTDQPNSPFALKDPQAITQTVEYDPETGLYLITEKVGDAYYRAPTYMTFEEYLEYSAQKEEKDYYKELIKRSTRTAGEDPITPYQSSVKDDLLCRLFGGCDIDIRPQGNIDLTLGGDYQRIQNPILTIQQQRQGGFDFDMNIQMNVTGQIGKRLKLSTNYNTGAQLNVDQQLKLEFLSDDVFTEDAIIKKIEAGNVSLPLRSTLIQGSQSLFGFKTALQFGRLTTTIVASQQQSRRQEITLQGGSQIQPFRVEADKYDENRHFFLSHYNRNSYEPALTNLPQINTLFRITKMEVWVTNDRNVTEGGVRDIVAVTDLGEPEVFANPGLVQSSAVQARDLRGSKLPDNDANNLFQNIRNIPGARRLDNAVNSLQNVVGLQQSRDFVSMRARKLAPSEYTFHPELGFVSLNINVQPDHVLGVAFQYTYNGRTYQVGEFAQDLPIDADSLNVLYVKMLKSVQPRIDVPLWDLMMKNVYSLSAYQVNQEDFRLDIFYQDPGGGEKRFLPDGPIANQPLMQLMNLDNLNRVNDPIPDGQFDFVPGLTILPATGRIIFPVLEPFGSSLSKFFVDANGNVDPSAEKYIYQPLYDSTVTAARERAELNRYIIKGTYKSAFSSEISLGAFNIPRGSVRVTAGGQQLVEGRDFQVDYNIGRIKILNDAVMASGAPIRVSFEDNALFGFQNRTLVGTRFDLYINDNFNIGGTFLRLSERPFTQKVNIGDDPIANNIFGVDVQYSKDAPWLTKLVDKIPLISTKAPSNIAFNGEAAYLLPGHAKVINQGIDDGGGVYLDDFEGSAARYPLGLPANSWVLASVPQNDPDGNNPLFPESALIGDVNYGKNRARMSWYNLDPILIGNQAPDNIPDSEKLSTYVRNIDQREVFPNVTIGQNQFPILRTFDMAYYPEERGPYNYDVTAGAYSDGIDPNTGELLNPKTRWAGIMRSIETNDFEAANMEFLEFWLMSPFKEGYGGTGGEFYIDLGNISEDILRDSRRFFENGMPGVGTPVQTDNTSWGRVPRIQAITNAFDNDPDSRLAQDIGLDGMNNELERSRLDSAFLIPLRAHLTPIAVSVLQALEEDPSSDDFRFYRDEFYDNSPPQEAIIGRYKRFNNPQGNSPASDPGNNFVSANTNIPDTEDINRDNTLNEDESYFHYKIPIKRDPLNQEQVELNNFITSSVVGRYTNPSGNEDSVYWYQFKVPLQQYTAKVGSIQDFRSIRFIRTYMHGWDDKVILRFARFELVRNQWRRYRRNLAEQQELIPPSENPEGTVFDVNAINIEENGSRQPIPYVLPPGISREQAIGPNFNALQNEQALSMTVCNLQDGDARGIFKNLNLDLRVYDRLKMFVHAEATPITTDYAPGDLTVFVRLGSDFISNYYEYEIPVTFSQMGSTTAEDIWPSINNFDFPLEILRQLKLQRNDVQASVTDPFSINDPDAPANFVTIVGTPDLGMVESVMIGIRNRANQGPPICAQIWVNELRVTGMNQDAAWAATGRLDLQLADLANVTLSAKYNSIGWGALDQRVTQRSREEILQYDFSTTVQLDKFLPKKWGIKLPMYAQVSNEIRTPQFDPYQLDVELKEYLRRATDRTERDSIRQQAVSVNSIRALNFTNVRKERTNKQKKPMPWDFANWSFTYGYTKNYRRTPIIASDNMTIHRGIIDYNYSTQPLYISPFKNLIKKGKWLLFIKEFNFNPIPNGLTFRNEATRRFGETVYRFAGPTNNTWYEKQFTWTRSYGLNWDLTKSLRMNFTATNNAFVDEPFGKIDTKEKRDTVWQNLGEFGRNRQYQHSLTASYQVPTKNFPLLDWTTVSAQYQTNYSWGVASLNTDSLGNIIQNGQVRTINGDLNFVNLYNKIEYFKKLNSPAKAKGKTGNRPTPPKPGEDKDAEKSDDTKDEKGGKDAKDKKDKKKKEREPSVFERALIRPLMSLRRMRITYTENFNTVLPGFVPKHKYLGQNQDFNAPGFDFTFGRQPDQAWLDAAAQKGWITTSIYQNQQFQQTHTQNIDVQAQLEPWQDFKIDVDFKRQTSRNYSEYFKVDSLAPRDQFAHLNRMEMGTLTMSYLPVKTLFDNRFTSDSLSQLFKTFEGNRQIISQRLGTGSHQLPEDATEGYTRGFGRYQQDVLVGAFIAAYTGQDANKVFLGDMRKLFPMPNWRLTYNGLAKLKFFSKFVSSFSLTHAYKSTLTVNSFATDLDFQESPTTVDPNTRSFYSTFEIPNIIITEQFAPLIGIDMRLKNEVSARFDYKKSRNLSMGFIDYQLSETKTSEITLGLGYRIKNKNLFELLSKKKKKKKKQLGDEDGNLSAGIINLGLGTVKPVHDINIKFDFSLRDDITFNHVLDQNVRVPTRGTKTIRISPSVDYIVNNRMTIRVFLDHNRTIPATSQSFPITTVRGGVTLRFSLTQ
jgi:cell surface protein SprA